MAYIRVALRALINVGGITRLSSIGDFSDLRKSMELHVYFVVLKVSIENFLCQGIVQVGVISQLLSYFRILTGVVSFSEQIHSSAVGA